MIEFILNNRKITTEKPAGMALLDFIRNESNLTATKVGCREGDCGACTVLEGSLKNRELRYKSIVSCLTPLINTHGKHIVTLEGINLDNLSPVQLSIKDNAATQCGFCTPGFVVSLTGNMMSSNKKDPIESISGNICRCTGYKSVEKAARDIEKTKETLLEGNEIKSMIEKKWLPDYFLGIHDRLATILPIFVDEANGGIFIAGGTDVMVQHPEKIRNNTIKTSLNNIPNSVEIENGIIRVGAGITMTDFIENEIIKSNFPSFKEYFQLIASEQIRNMGTLAGNIVNASPIGDLSVLFLAMNAILIIENENESSRETDLCDFFIDYKKTVLHYNEVIKYLVFSKLDSNQKINFEKVSKRTYLDIASVNSAITISIDNTIIDKLSLSVGGVAPFPLLMKETIAFLKGKVLNTETLKLALDKVNQEISPISDIRGSKEYKRLLLRQLFLQHFLKLFPELINENEIYNIMTTKALPYEKY